MLGAGRVGGELGGEGCEDLNSFCDHHSELDIDNMSYEASIGLSEEIIARVAKTNICLLPNNLEGVTSEDQDTDLCDEFKTNEEIGILQCQHKFHADCIRRWLGEKGVCPIYKSEVLDHE
ncbi:hypothetical protein V8G54_024077 [Vigna mungo]|uniref:RING-type E3 ubiquitin transferase n=1 Tax=Vigna mungo TaxID=3915 RepID=A0AAQ3RT53_VIGMU